MSVPLAQETLIAVVCAIGVGLTFALVAFALSSGADGRRYRRRLNSVRDRAQGLSSGGQAATQSLSRQQSATPKIDRIARRWLPRRDILAARLARTGRAISIGQYAIVTFGLTAASAISLV